MATTTSRRSNTMKESWTKIWCSSDWNGYELVSLSHNERLGQVTEIWQLKDAPHKDEKKNDRAEEPEDHIRGGGQKTAMKGDEGDEGYEAETTGSYK